LVVRGGYQRNGQEGWSTLRKDLQAFKNFRMSIEPQEEEKREQQTKLIPALSHFTSRRAWKKAIKQRVGRKI